MPHDGSRYLAMDDESLLADCDFHTYKSSGPGGQHRNKTLSAVRLIHRPTGIMVHGDDSRSQHENKRLALRRLRMNIACQLRNGVDLARDGLPPIVNECIFSPRGPRGQPAGQRQIRRLQIGPKDERFWQVAAFLLDLLDAAQGRLAEAAGQLGIGTSNLANALSSERHLLAAAQQIRKQHGLGTLK